MGRIPGFLKESVLACVVGALILPNMIAIATVTFVLSAPPSGRHQWDDALNRTPTRCVFFGVLFALLFYVPFSVLALRRFARADGACPDVFAELHQEYDEVQARLQAEDGAGAKKESAAYTEASRHCAHLDEAFADPKQVKLRWLLASGYLDAWRRLHAADNALMFLEPDDKLVSRSLDDEMRLQGSTIPLSAVLQSRLRIAVERISTSASSYFIDLPNPRTAPSGKAQEEMAKPEAVAVLAQVSAAIDEFRDKSREGLVRSRNRPWAAVIVEGITGCVLLGVAVLSGAGKSSITAVAAFFLVGGIVGLIRQLQVAATDIAQDDYGLGIVRLFQTPLLSGIAGVGGVILVKLSQGQPVLLQLQKTFDLQRNPYGLVAAAIFGLAPSLLLAGLQQRADQYKSDLAHSDTSRSSPPPAT
jgi:hypothetical protein